MTARRQAVRRLIRGGPSQLVAAPAAPALDAGFTRLAAGRSETEMRPDVPSANHELHVIQTKEMVSWSRTGNRPAPPSALPGQRFRPYESVLVARSERP
jgi:hypothetical protein